MKTSHEIGWIRLQYRESSADIGSESFYLVREPPSGQSLIALAEQNWELITAELVVATQQLDDHLLELSNSHSSIMAMVCETNPLRDLNPWTLESFTDLILLTQFRQELRNRDSISVEYHGDSPRFSQSIGRMCQQEGVLFEAFLKSPTAHKSRLTLFERLRRTPSLHLIREFCIRHSFARCNTKRPQFVGSIALVAPFAHQQRSTEGEQGFRSGYWGSLPDRLVELGFNVLFVHHISPVLTWRQRRRSVRAISRATQNSPNVKHVLSHPPLTLAQAAGSWRQWRNLRLPLAQMLEEMDLFVQGKHFEWLWSFLRPSVEQGLLGHRSLVDLAIHRSMDSDAGTFGSVKRWVIACENQSWERSFISSRRREGYRYFDGFAHVPIRYWDLRYFALTHEIATTSAKDLHRGFDRLLVGGEGDLQLLRPFADLSCQVSVVEALRFRSVPAEDVLYPESVSIGRIVVLGDYDRGESELVVRVAEKILNLLPTISAAIFRPHPLHLKRDTDLVELVSRYASQINPTQKNQALVVASSRTSAFYPYLNSMAPVVIALGARTLNFCPVENFPGLTFVSDASSEVGLDSLGIIQSDGPSRRLQDILALDEGLPRWLQALDLDQQSSSRFG